MAGIQDSAQPKIPRDDLVLLKPGIAERDEAIVELADRLVKIDPQPENVDPKYDHSIAEMATYAAIGAALRNAKAEWVRSQDAIDLKTRLVEAVKQKKLVGVRNIVCFSLGEPKYWRINNPPTDEAKQKGHGNASLIFHVAALWMAEVIMGASGHQEKVTVYCQNPSYRPEDKMALVLNGFRVLDGQLNRHEGFVRVGSDSLVFMMSNTDNIEVICKTTRPAAIICSLMPWQKVEGARKILFAEYDKDVWEPFYNPRIGGGYPAIQTTEEYDKEGQRPLQGASVWILKTELNPAWKPTTHWWD
ncbi:hypothetical protein F5Y03DRAFT_400142 [Xylaria venustula]|nr:hypothetical protein F5Y03DRAFT_400142 [Xylaria venustula]